MCSPKLVNANVLPEVTPGSRFPGPVDVLKVDVDSFDCQLLAALLPQVEATVVILEVPSAHRTTETQSVTEAWCSRRLSI